MKIQILLIVFNLIGYSLLGQIQVSDIERLEYSNDIPVPFKYNDTPYLIFKQKEKTSIFNIDTSGLTQGYVSDSRPFGSNYVGFSVFDQYLFEYYYSGYVCTDVSTKEILDTISFGIEFELVHRGGIIDNRFSYSYLSDSLNEIHLYFYDLESKESQIIKIENSRIVISDITVFIIENNKEVYHYDLANFQKDLLFSYADEVANVGRFGDHIFVADSSNLLNIFDSIGIVETLNCFEEEDEIRRLELVGNSLFASVSGVNSNGSDSLKC